MSTWSHEGEFCLPIGFRKACFCLRQEKRMYWECVYLNQNFNSLEMPTELARLNPVFTNSAVSSPLNFSIIIAPQHKGETLENKVSIDTWQICTWVFWAGSKQNCFLGSTVMIVDMKTGSPIKQTETQISHYMICTVVNWQQPDCAGIKTVPQSCGQASLLMNSFRMHQETITKSQQNLIMTPLLLHQLSLRRSQNYFFFLSPLQLKHKLGDFGFFPPPLNF